MNANTAIALMYIATVAGFTFTAYQFGHWWIILFSLLFSVTTSKTKDDE